MEKFYSAHKRLTKLRRKAASELVHKHAHAIKYLKKKKILPPSLKYRARQLIAGATLAGSLLLTQGNQTLAAPILDRPSEERLKKGLVTSDEVQTLLAKKLSPFLPLNIGKLDKDAGDKICQTIKEILGVDVCIELESFKLNFDYAWTGYEQHLYRFPEDDLSQHDEEQEAGIAPGLGAWGYFAESRNAMTNKDKLREKYYVVVQTLYFDDWEERSEEIYNFFKFRKMIMINPENGRACVAAVGDAGPAQWTGKQFGASPEVMKNLNLHLEMRKGKVLLLFVKDPEDKIPLGPIDYNALQGIPQTV